MEYNLWHIGLFLLVLPVGCTRMQHIQIQFTKGVHLCGLLLYCFHIYLDNGSVVYFILEIDDNAANLSVYFSQCVWPLWCVSDKGAVTRLLGIHVQMQPIHIFSVVMLSVGLVDAPVTCAAKEYLRFSSPQGYTCMQYGAIYEGCRWLLT